MDRVFHINAPAVVSEIIDGEAVIMNLKSGNYYSTAQVGSMVWGWIEQGRTRGQLLALLKASFGTVPDDFAQAVDTFIDDLIAQELVREELTDHAVPLSDGDALPPLNGTHGFSAPVLNVYSDMKDLLLLDPIHDVDEIGWPTPKPSHTL
ncbi:MAG TPA: PqqD family protein [Stellaceae bacterium]|nr:PqqD family protein [Stellaceae bacterium]